MKKKLSNEQLARANSVIGITGGLMSIGLLALQIASVAKSIIVAKKLEKTKAEPSEVEE